MNKTVPQFTVDPSWPKPLPENWMLGQCAGIAVDSHDNIWVAHRPNSLDAVEAGAAQVPPTSECCVPAPPVLCFDPEGNVIHTFGGIGVIDPWPRREHGVYVDLDDHIWVGGNGVDAEGRGDNMVVKFDLDGKLLLVLGEPGETGGSNDTRLLGQTAGIHVVDADNEVYLADGYVNRRIIVFDATTGAYKRHWGAYGERPHDDALPPYDPSQPAIRSFRSAVHSVQVARDGLVYAADRANCRVQVFQKDGTYVTEAFIRRETLGAGSAWDMELSTDPEQQFLYVADGANFKVWILDRKSLEVVGSFGRGGRQVGQFEWVHNLAADSKGNLYTAEVNNGKRIQKFTSR